MDTDTATAAPDGANEALGAFETSAAFWALDISRHVNLLRENSAVGVADEAARTAAGAALAKLEAEIARFQEFARGSHDFELLTRLAETAANLQQGRRVLVAALNPPAIPDSPAPPPAG